MEVKTMTMRKALYIVFTVIALCVASCTDSASWHDKEINNAERLIQTNTDSALSILDAIDPSDLTIDSIRAKYHYLRAWGHLCQNRSMIGDSLVGFSHNYYRDKDIEREIRTGTALAWYKFWIGDMTGAINLLDSLSNLTNVPDSLKLQALRIRVLLGASEYQGRELIPLVKKLEAVESDSLRKMEAKFMLVSAYEYAELLDSALILTEYLIDDARKSKWGDKQFLFEIERAQILCEMGRNNESDAVIDGIFAKSSPDNGAADILHLQYAMNALNIGDTQRASREIAKADSFAIKLRHDGETRYHSYRNILRAMIEFKQTGKMKLANIIGLNNRQQERYNRIKASQWEAERGALQQQNRAILLKSESEYKTMIILVVCLVSIILLASAGLIIRHRRQRELENEERTEALQKMVEELKASSKSPQSDSSVFSALRCAMLKELGIIKFVAETPTEQNRDMLSKISSIESDTNGELVNWDSVFNLINNLYEGFYTKLHSKYGNTLIPKEEQIIVLMIAGFSTKEISVITSQTTSTIYVRKSSIRKKLGMAEKTDIETFLKKDLNR